MIDQQIKQIEAQRVETVNRMLEIRSMCRGALSEQFLTGRLANGEEVERGPYYVLSCWTEGKNRSRRVRAREVTTIKRDLDKYEEFGRLCDEFSRLTEELGRLERERIELKDDSKKNSNSQSRRTRK